MASKDPLGASYWKLWAATAISNLGDGVSMVAYPWLASAITRSPILIALAAVASRLPWLIFTLPAGVITDRFDRKKIMVSMDVFRALLTATIAGLVWLNVSTLPKLDEVANLPSLTTHWSLYYLMIISAFLFGGAEVLRDNTAQTLLPSVVRPEQLEKANGRIWSAESLTNSFIGPPLGSALIGIAIFIPFFFDTVTFFLSAILIGSIGSIAAIGGDEVKEKKVKIDFKREIKEGFSWLWAHELLRPMAIILGSINGAAAISGAAFILFAQEILHTSVFIFAILGTAGAVGGIVGGLLAPKISAKIGRGPSLWLALALMPIFISLIGFTSSWQIVWVLTALGTILVVLWNVITVSLRQAIIPTQLLGRVNSVYRFFGWGTMPLGILLGGVIITVVERIGSREMALRTPYFVSGALGLLIFFLAAPKLTTAKIEAARGR